MTTLVQNPAMWLSCQYYLCETHPASHGCYSMSRRRHLSIEPMNPRTCIKRLKSATAALSLIWDCHNNYVCHQHVFQIKHLSWEVLEFSYTQKDYNIYILSSFLLLWNDLVKNQWSFYYQSLSLVSMSRTHTWCTVPNWSWTQLQHQLEIFHCNTFHEICQTWNPWWECVSLGMSCEESQKVSDRHLPPSLPGCPSIHPCDSSHPKPSLPPAGSVPRATVSEVLLC